MNNGINLLSDKRDAKFLTSSKEPLKIFRFGAIGILFLVGAFSVILSILIVLSPLPELRKEEENARNELAAFLIDMNKLAFVNNRGDSIRKILAARPSYDKKLDIIESKMDGDVSLDMLMIVKKKYTLTFSSDNLNSLDKLLNNLTEITGSSRDFFRIYLNSLSMDKEDMKFVLVVDLFTI